MKDIEISERKLEDMVFEILKNQDKYPDKFDFLEHSDLVIRQLNLNNYGIPDIVTFSYDVLEGFVVNIYELKKDKIGIGAFLQAVGYVKGIKSYFKKRGYGDTMLFKICLIGKSVDTSGNFSFIPDLINFSNPDEQPFYDMGMILDINFITYKMTINGLEFKYKNNYALVGEGF